MPATMADLRQLASRLEGGLHFDEAMRKLYATDASEYQEMPLAVALPQTEEDVRELLLFANRHRVGLIPRTAGTSLAGQVVGSGIVVDVGRHLRGEKSPQRGADDVVLRREGRVRRGHGGENSRKSRRQATCHATIRPALEIDLVSRE